MRTKNKNDETMDNKIILVKIRVEDSPKVENNTT